MKETLQKIKANLDNIRHTLVAHYGLLATDQQGIVMDTDANKNMCFEIDYGNEIALLDEARRLVDKLGEE